MSSSTTISSPQKRAKIPSPEKNAPSKTASISAQKRAASINTKLIEPPPKIRPFSSLQAKGMTTPDLHKPLRSISTDSLENIPSPEASSVVSKLLPDAVSASPPALGIQTPRHILFEGFPLIKGKTEPPRVPSNEQIKLIRGLFDGVTEVSVNASFLIVRCRSLPPKPWPLTIGGIPLWLTDSPTDTPMPNGKSGRSAPVLPKLALSKIRCPAGNQFALIGKYFLENLGLSISEIMWSGIYLRLKVPENVHLSTLPFKIGGLLALYDPSSAIPDHHEAAKRLVSPTPTVRDDTCYTPNLRPGIMLSCGVRGGEELFTSSGVIVQDRKGDKWLTVASHGFPLGNETVHHPTASYPTIGFVEKKFAETDISLVKLHSDVHYASQTFSSDLKPATEITSLKDPADLLLGDLLTMENAFSGYCEGIFLDAIWKAIPDDEEREHPWVVISSFYLGNGGEEPLDGSCGSPVLTESGEVVGLFRFLADNGRAYCVSAELLLRLGMTLSSI